MAKKFISVLITLTLILCFIPTAFASESTNAKLYTVYADGMLFKHSEEAILAGTGKAGDTITAELYHGKKLISSGMGTVGSDGKFTVSFTAPKGSYDQYIIIMTENGTIFKTLKNIVFGELWLASGQSNMMYPLAQSKTGKEMWANQQKLSSYLRVLMVPGYPEYKGETALTLLPLNAQDDITDAQWVTGEDLYVYNMSAVAYFFAEQMMEKFDMPVGILNSSLGGSSIASWLSRETCESNSLLTEYLAEKGQYVKASEWKEDAQDVYTSVTANYNQKIHPLKYFRPTGMIWYQGETDISWTDEMYGLSFDLMQKSYSKLFGFENKLMPIVYTQLAPYNYGHDTMLPQRNYYYSLMQQEYSSSRAVISIHDLPMTYDMSVGVIHPESKEEVGQRMFFAAEGLVYGKRKIYTVATVKNAEIRNGSIFVTFENIGDELKANGDKLKGFAICNDSGVYVQADAEIVSNDTVRIYAKGVNEPKSASYAFCPSNMRSNLYGTENGKLTLPVGPFVTDGSYMTKTWKDLPWTDCDDEKTWFNNADPYSAYYDSWVSENATLSFPGSYMNVNGHNEFTVSPTITFEENRKTSFQSDSERDFSDYGTLSFSVRNNGTEDVTFEGLQLYKNTIGWYYPEANSNEDSSVIIPADGEWHVITLDLNKLYLWGNECGATRPNNSLRYIQEMYFCFSAEGESEISIDNFRFTPEEENFGWRFDSKISNADNVWEFISALFTSLIGIFF